MQNAITYAINEVKSRIPYSILELAFLSNNVDPNTTMDMILNDTVIQNYVLVDCGIAGGKTKNIVLLLKYLEPVTNNYLSVTQNIGSYSIYRIPPDVREGLDIQSIVNISYGYMRRGGFNGVIPPTSGVTATGLANEVIESHTFSSSVPLPVPILLPGNIIKITPAQYNHVDWHIACKLAYDANMTSASSQTIIPFSKLVIYKTQMLVYNNLVVMLDKGFIQGGAEIGVIKDIVDNYADAFEKYDEALMEWRGSNYLDAESKLLLFRYML